MVNMWVGRILKRVQSLVRNGHEMERINGSVNTFPQQRIRTQQWKNYVYYVIRAERL
jgi:hypothetical protein